MEELEEVEDVLEEKVFVSSRSGDSCCAHTALAIKSRQQQLEENVERCEDRMKELTIAICKCPVFGFNGECFAVGSARASLVQTGEKIVEVPQDGTQEQTVEAIAEVPQVDAQAASRPFTLDCVRLAGTIPVYSTDEACDSAESAEVEGSIRGGSTESHAGGRCRHSSGGSGHGVLTGPCGNERAARGHCQRASSSGTTDGGN